MKTLSDHTRAPVSTEVGPADVRRELRRQIARLERELGELFASTFPRVGIEWGVPAAGGPRVVDVADLERLRDRLAARVSAAKAEIGRRADAEEDKLVLIEKMIARPDRYRWVRVDDQVGGTIGCRQWESRPRFGILGMLLGWWRIKVSSGCPLAWERRPTVALHSDGIFILT